MSVEKEVYKKNIVIFYLTLVIGLILFIIVDQIRIHYKDIKIDEIKNSHMNLVEKQLQKDIHLLNNSYKDNLILFEKRDSIRNSQINILITANIKLKSEINKEHKKITTFQYKIDSIDERLFLPNPYIVK